MTLWGSERKRCAKFKTLKKEPKGRDVEADSCTFNSDFSFKHLRFKVGTIAATARPPRSARTPSATSTIDRPEDSAVTASRISVEKQESCAKVDEDRKPQIDAALVLVMKSRKNS